MKKLELSDLENISGGNALETVGKYIFCTVLALGSFALHCLAIRMLIN